MQYVIQALITLGIELLGVAILTAIFMVADKRIDKKIVEAERAQ